MIEIHQHNFRRMAWLRLGVLLLLAATVSACEATTAQVMVLPTDPPTATPTFTPSPSRTPGADATPTDTPTRVPVSPTGGPSPTSIFGATSTPSSDEPTPTRVLNPNAPRIEFFTSDVVAAAPGENVTLFWSTRNIANASIYRLDFNGTRSQVWNVPADGQLTVPTRRSDRGQIDFILSIGDGPQAIEQPLTIPLSCPDPWFFIPAPDDCPTGPQAETALIEERFERGRMLYVGSSNQVYALFNDGFEPAWLVYENRYDPAIHPEVEESFLPPPGFSQPIGILGFVWRRDVVRNRLGLALEPEARYDGAVQTSPTGTGENNLYVSSADGTIIQLLPDGSAWQIITPP